jgi:hypothetical protein
MPGAYFFEQYACGSERNYTNYCNPELEKMYEQQSIEPDQTKRKQLVWEIDRRLQEDAARPMIFDYRLGTCRSRAVHGITIMVNSLFNGWRLIGAGPLIWRAGHASNCQTRTGKRRSRTALSTLFRSLAKDLPNSKNTACASMRFDPLKTTTPGDPPTRQLTNRLGAPTTIS